MAGLHHGIVRMPQPVKVWLVTFTDDRLVDTFINIFASEAAAKRSIEWAAELWKRQFAWESWENDQFYTTAEDPIDGGIYYHLREIEVQR